MLSNAYLLANIGFGTAENEPAKMLQNVAKICHFCQFCAGEVPGAGASPQLAALIAAQDEAAEAMRPRSFADVRELRLAKFRQGVARFRLYRLRFLQENMRLTAFFKLYKICILLHRCNLKYVAKNRFEKKQQFS